MALPEATAEDLAKRFAQLEGGARGGGLNATSVAPESDSVVVAAVSVDAVLGLTVSPDASPFNGFSARTGLASLVVGLGRAGTTGTTGTAERVGVLLAFVEAVLVAVSVRGRSEEYGVVGVAGVGCSKRCW